jgi:hypothetical protein
MRDEVKHFIISSLTRLQSKKFIVWTIASVAMFTGYLQSTDWMYITTMYLGAQGLIDWKDNSKKIIDSPGSTQ